MAESKSGYRLIRTQKSELLIMVLKLGNYKMKILLSNYQIMVYFQLLSEK